MLVTSTLEINRISSHAETLGRSQQTTWADDLFGASEPVATQDLQETVSADAPASDEIDPYYVAPTLFMSSDEAQSTLPAYLSIFSLEELGMLHLFEHSPAMTRPAALRMAHNRGLAEDAAHEVVDFYFMRKGSIHKEGMQKGAATAGAPVVPASDDSPHAPKRARKRSASAEPSEPVVHVLGEAPETVCTLPLKGADQVALRLDLVEELERSYPVLDVRMELVRMDQWLQANPEKRKTSRGARRFINTWLSNAADRERMRRDMLSAVTPVRNGFGTGSGAGASAHAAKDEMSASSEPEDGLGDFLA